MDFFGLGIPVGRYWGITVRLHFTFILYVFWRASTFDNFALGIVFFLGVFLSVLLHEFGHAFAARWCDGEANEILLWPLGGLAFVRPAFNPTAHLITTVAGPFVTLVLWIFFSILTFLLASSDLAIGSVSVAGFCGAMAAVNLILLLFNLIPAFPMDGGRIFRDVLWHWVGAERATQIAVQLSRVIAIGGMIYGFATGWWWIGILALFIFLQAPNAYRILAVEAGGIHQFSVKERIKRGWRKHAFQSKVRAMEREGEMVGFHRCSSCGRTDHEFPSLDFRVCPVCTGSKEYCSDHLRGHTHS